MKNMGKARAKGRAVSGIKISTISMLHYVRLIYRSVIFLVMLVLYLRSKLAKGEELANGLESSPVALTIIWLIFMVEMILRFFPSKYESPGCQKQFRQNYIPSGSTDIEIPDNNGTVLTALVWLVFNSIFGALHMAGVLDDGIMLLLCSFYSVCDMICILFFCPFQTWFMKNKCCSACRIYNWDYTMMFTPLFFVRRYYSYSLLAVSIILLFRWEITFYRYPERFSEKTNCYLRCEGCTEKLCAHKKQLRTLWKQIEAYTAKRAGIIKGK